MTNFNYFKQTKTKKIRYLKYKQKNRPYIVFLHGFMSNLEGKSPKLFYHLQKKISWVSWLWNILGMENPLENS